MGYKNKPGGLSARISIFLEFSLGRKVIGKYLLLAVLNCYIVSWMFPLILMLSPLFTNFFSFSFYFFISIPFRLAKTWCDTPLSFDGNKSFLIGQEIRISYLLIVCHSWSLKNSFLSNFPTPQKFLRNSPNPRKAPRRRLSLILIFSSMHENSAVGWMEI